MTRYEELITRKRAQYGDKFDPSELAPQFVEAFNRGQSCRVAVPAFSGEPGKKSWGHIGVTTGWRPVFLLMRSSRCYGSSYVLKSDTPIIGCRVPS